MALGTSKPTWPISVKRAVAILLMLAASSVTVGACAGTGSDYWRERPSSANYMRLPVR